MPHWESSTAAETPPSLVTDVFRDFIVNEVIHREVILLRNRVSELEQQLLSLTTQLKLLIEDVELHENAIAYFPDVEELSGDVKALTKRLDVLDAQNQEAIEQAIAYKAYEDGEDHL